MNDVIFIRSPLYKELMFLTLISKCNDITQRDIALKLEVSLAMVNGYVEKYEKNKLIRRIYLSKKNVKYQITEKGEERRKMLNLSYLKASLDVFNSASNECVSFLNKLFNRGYKNIIFYGAGEVGEIMLHAISNRKDIAVNVLAVIDDDLNKVGKTLINKEIISLNDINKYNYDGILISSYTNKEMMRKKLIILDVNQEKIIEYF